MQDILIDYKKKLQSLDEKEKILRDLYLRDIALGKIYGPMLGCPSIDKPHLAFYKPEYIEKPIPRMTATEYLKEMNKKHLEMTAIDCKDEFITYNELFEEIDQTAAALHKLGLRNGKLVVGMLPSDTAHEVYLLYGACSAGGAVSFIVQQTPLDVICQTINTFCADYFFVSNDDFTSEMETVIYQETSVKNIINVSSNPLFYNDKRTISWEQFQDYGTNYKMPIIHRSPNDLLFMAKTGGSTGAPKNVMLNDNSFNIMVHQLLNSNLNYNAGDRWLRVWSLFSASAAISSSHLALCSGMVNILRTMPTPENFSKVFMQEKPNHLCLVSALIDLLIFSGITTQDIEGFIKTAGVGGESITPQFEKRAEEFLPTYLGYGYGCTENSSSAVMRMNRETSIPGTIGVPLVKTVVSAFDVETMCEKTYNEEGEICINSYTPMIGYYNDKKLTDEVLQRHSDGSIWIHTGDLGFINEKGFVTITGRIKRFIFVYSGDKVYPVQLEDLISEVAGVIKVAVVKMPDLNHREYFAPAACVVIDPNYDVKKVKQNILQQCKEHLPYYAIPQDIIIKDDFPYLASGKPDLKTMEHSIESLYQTN